MCSLSIAMINIILATQYLFDVIKLEQSTSTTQKLQQETLFIRKKISIDYAKAKTKIKKIPHGFTINGAQYTFDPVNKLFYHQSKENPRPSQKEIVSRNIDKIVIQESKLTIYFKSAHCSTLVVHCVVQD
jgi:hypothetical protein